MTIVLHPHMQYMYLVLCAKTDLHLEKTLPIVLATQTPALFPGFQLMNKTVCIIESGKHGNEAAQMLKKNLEKSLDRSVMCA